MGGAELIGSVNLELKLDIDMQIEMGGWKRVGEVVMGHWPHNLQSAGRIDQNKCQLVADLRAFCFWVDF